MDARPALGRLHGAHGGARMAVPAATLSENPETSKSHTWRPVWMALISAFLMFCSFPPADCGYLAWFALAPLFLLVHSQARPLRLYAASWCGGLVFWLLSVQWIRHVTPDAWPAWIVLSLVLSLWWPAFLLFARIGVKRLKLPLILVAPIVWVALEYVRAYAFTGLPWFYLAHTQYRYLPVIQISD